MSEELEWLTNAYDPRRADARAMYAGLDWRHYQEWLKGKIILEPKPTPDYTVEELRGEGMVGIYRKRG